MKIKEVEDVFELVGILAGKVPFIITPSQHSKYMDIVSKPFVTGELLDTDDVYDIMIEHVDGSNDIRLTYGDGVYLIGSHGRVELVGE